MTATVTNETGPTWFVFESKSGDEFKIDDSVEFHGPRSTVPDLIGHVIGTKTTNFGNPPKQCLQLSIAIDDGDLSRFKEGGFAGYEVRSKSSSAKAVVHPSCKAKFPAQLIKTHALQTMYEKAESLIATAAEGKNKQFVDQWFGTLAPSKGSELQKIYDRCSQLHAGMGYITKVVFEVVGGEFLGGIDPKVKQKLNKSGTCRIQLGRGFLYTRYSWGEKVATIVHELTHWILGTIDQKFGADDAYGAKCLALTRDGRECSKALTNADNWAFYICQYRGDGAGEDWRYFSESEMKERVPFAKDTLNVDMSLVLPLKV